jgi:nucleotide-binding universal stress UspA family protein
VTSRLGHGDPATAILAIAADGVHDLIVMGSHGRGRIHRALLGSVSERVLREAPVPVLLMRASKGDGDRAARGGAT